MKKILTAAALAASMATGASAATTIELASGGDVTVSGGVGTFSSGGFSGTITASSFSFLPIPSIPAAVNQNVAGLGVTGVFDADPSLDGRISESLTFTFDQKVRLVSVTYYNFDENDDADVYVNGVRVADESVENPYEFGYVEATSFTIGADGTGYWFSDGYDNFRVKRFTVAAVPVPAAGFLLLGGLAGLGLVGRKRRKSA